METRTSACVILFILFILSQDLFVTGLLLYYYYYAFDFCVCVCGLCFYILPCLIFFGLPIFHPTHECYCKNAIMVDRLAFFLFSISIYLLFSIYHSYLFIDYCILRYFFHHSILCGRFYFVAMRVSPLLYFLWSLLLCYSILTIIFFPSFLPFCIYRLCFCCYLFH